MCVLFVVVGLFVLPFLFDSNLSEEEIAGCFPLIVSGCLWSVSLPHGAIGLSAVCNCDISWSYSPFLSSVCNVIYSAKTDVYVMLIRLF